MIKVAHITSVHARYDTRIYLKECQSLAENGFDVQLIVADGKGDENKSNIKIHDVGKSINRLYRIFITTYKIYRYCVKQKKTVIHFHDPELIFAGFFLKILHKRKVIYDIHENYVKTLAHSYWLKRIYLAQITSKIYRLIEKTVSASFSANVIVLDQWKDKYKRSVVVKNYPKLPDDDFSLHEKSDFIYLGGLSQKRGILELLKIFNNLNTDNKYRLHIIGTFSEQKTEIEALKLKTPYTIFYGYKPLSEVRDLLRTAQFGFCLYTQDEFEENIPVKMYEYLSYNTPVICTNFKSWENQMNHEKWGIAVDPFNVEEATRKIRKALMPLEYKKIYENCNEWKNKYTWANEEAKLLTLYRTFEG